MCLARRRLQKNAQDVCPDRRFLGPNYPGRGNDGIYASLVGLAITRP